MKLHRQLRFLALALILAGLIGIVPLGYFNWRNKVAVAQGTATIATQSPVKPNPSVNLVTGKPVSIAIPSLQMNLQIIDGVYKQSTGQWTLTLDKAQFALPSAQPNNQSGNTLIYGHYRKAVFAYLHLIQPGAQATLTTANGYQFTYTYQSSQAFDPTDTSIFAYDGPPRLTIQTCSGTFFQHRQMYYFQYDGYAKV